MPIPDYETLMLPVLRAVEREPKPIRRIIDELAAQVGLSEEERAAKIPSGTAGLFANRVHWAKTYLKQAGAVQQPSRGVVSLTERGRGLLDSNPTRIDNSVLIRFEEFREFRSRPAPRQGPSGRENGGPFLADLTTETPEERIGRAALEPETSLRRELLGRLKPSDPSFFERVVLDVLKALGYGAGSGGASEVVGGAGDGGIDGVIDEDRLGLDRIYVQAKRYADQTVGAQIIQSFIGALQMRGAAKGVLITTSRFTADAERAARIIPSLRIVLIDGERLAELMIRHGVGVRVRRTIEIKDIDLDYFEPDEP
ncbi:MAG: restriction endonuclease [Acetobacteraceae bacterium]